MMDVAGEQTATRRGLINNNNKYQMIQRIPEIFVEFVPFLFSFRLSFPVDSEVGGGGRKERGGTKTV